MEVGVRVSRASASRFSTDGDGHGVRALVTCSLRLVGGGYTRPNVSTMSVAEESEAGVGCGEGIAVPRLDRPCPSEPPARTRGVAGRTHWPTGSPPRTPAARPAG